MPVRIRLCRIVLACQPPAGLLMVHTYHTTGGRDITLLINTAQPEKIGTFDWKILPEQSLYSAYWGWGKTAITT
eukprot:6018051-Ditylum_brightwellii.AAC.1